MFKWISAALICSDKMPYKLAYKRLTCKHPFSNSEKIETQRYENHPHSDKDLIYAITLRHCGNCGLVFQDRGLEYRGK